MLTPKKEKKMKRCKCVFTTSQTLHAINEKRERHNLDLMPYATFMRHYRAICPVFPPDNCIGNNYLFHKGTMEKIVKCVWKRKYRITPRVDWKNYKAA